MSKPSAAKKARRRKRLAVREAKRLPDWLFDDENDEDDEDDEPTLELSPRNVTEVILGVGGSVDDGYSEDVVDLVERASQFERRIVKRGWVFDTEYSSDDGFASWFFPPSGTELDDERLETVTRIWLTPMKSDIRDERDFPNSVHAILVGSDEAHCLPPDRLLQHLDSIESYRIGDPYPGVIRSRA